MPKKVLCLLFPGFEEIETIAPVDILRRAGVEVTMASLLGGTTVSGRSNIAVQADAEMAGLNSAVYDLLLIPGGPGVKAVRADGRAALMAGELIRNGKAVAAICAAPLVLADAGLLKGRKFTAHFSACGELPEALQEERVVCDGNIITSRGAGTALDFGLALAGFLCGESTARDVAKAIML